MVATMFGSLIVHARRIDVAEVRRRRARRSGRSGRRSSASAQPPRRRHPARRREVVERDDRVDARLEAAPRTSAGSGRARRARTRPPRARCGSTRSRTGSCRTRGRRRRAMSSGQRCQLSHASPLGSAHREPGVCSHAHQSLFQLPPSTWWAAVAVPQRKPSGKRTSRLPGMAGRRSRPARRARMGR